MGLELTSLRIVDLPQVLAIERRSFPRPWTLSNFLGELANRCSQQLVVRDSGAEIVGYAVFWLMADELELLNLAVDQAARRKGLGGQLLTAVLCQGRQRGAKRAFLEVRPSNRAARSLYERFGFAETGRRRHYYDDDHEDALVLSRTLDGGGTLGDSLCG